MALRVDNNILYTNDLEEIIHFSISYPADDPLSNKIIAKRKTWLLQPGSLINKYSRLPDIKKKETVYFFTAVSKYAISTGVHRVA